MADRKKISVYQVAEKAGVSAATVSRAMNHPELVNKRTYDKIISAAQMTGYLQKNRALRSNLILVFLPSLENSFYSGIFRGIRAAAERCGYQFLVQLTKGPFAPSLEEFREICRMTQAAGIISLLAIPECVLAELEKEVAVVQCSECDLRSRYSYVTIDNYNAAKNMVRTLIRDGSSKIALINSASSFYFARERRKGYEEALREAGLPLQAGWVQEVGSFDFMSAYSVVTKMLLASEDHPDAIFGVSDVYAAAAIKAAKACGLRVPEDLRVAGFDNINVCHMTDPAITTVVQPAVQMGNMAFEILHEHIDNPLLAPQQVILATEIVVRGSI